MGKILCIDTATSSCSAAIGDSGQLIALKESCVKNIHASSLTVFVEEVLKSAGISFSALDAIAISMGPGSYTGLRIGVAAAKGFCYATDKPLIAIPTLKAMAWGMRLEMPPPSPSPEDPPAGKAAEGIKEWCYCPMIDARRMEVFYSIYNEYLHEISETRAEIIHEHSFRQFLSKQSLVFAGEGMEKCKPFLKKFKNANFIDGFTNSSKFMVPLAEEKFQNRTFENLAYFEPFYLKDFIAGKANVKGLNS